MKIIIAGLSDHRRKIVEDLSPECRVVGYVDSKAFHRGFSSFDYVPYYAVPDLKTASYDYLVISYAGLKETLAFKNELKECSIATENVIEYALFRETLCIDPVRAFANTDGNFDLFLFGMSYSQCSL